MLYPEVNITGRDLIIGKINAARFPPRRAPLTIPDPGLEKVPYSRPRTRIFDNLLAQQYRDEKGVSKFI